MLCEQDMHVDYIWNKYTCICYKLLLVLNIHTENWEFSYGQTMFRAIWVYNVFREMH